MFESSLRSRARDRACCTQNGDGATERAHSQSVCCILLGCASTFFFLSVFLFVFCNEHSAHSVSKIARARAYNLHSTYQQCTYKYSNETKWNDFVIQTECDRVFIINFLYFSANDCTLNMYYIDMFYNFCSFFFLSLLLLQQQQGEKSMLEYCIEWEFSYSEPTSSPDTDIKFISSYLFSFGRMPTDACAKSTREREISYIFAIWINWFFIWVFKFTAIKLFLLFFCPASFRWSASIIWFGL